MSFSRESSEGDQSGTEDEFSLEEAYVSDEYESESFSESEEDLAVTFLRVLIFSPHLTAENKIALTLTSYTNYHLVIEWILQNLKLLCESRNSSLLFLLEYLIGEKTVIDENEKGQEIAKAVLTSIPSLSAEQHVNEQSFQRIINAVRKSGYRNPMHESTIASCVTFYGNYKILNFLLKNNFPFELHLDKIKDKFQFYMARKVKAKAECFLRTFALATELELKNTLRSVNKKIQHFKFVIHNNGGVLIEGRESRVPGHAAKVYEIINAALNANEAIIDKFDEVVVRIKNELSENNSDDANSGWLSFSWIKERLPQIGGARDSSTDRCYDAILGVLAEGTQILNEYKQIHQQYADQWCDRDGIVLSAYPTMPQ